ncbi:MAG TPA: metalloregulator ArsR/SmtB family transcription factor, partial [Halanaerobiales bacterium]|nr:metalloregulator ArsR/SmtB family transcription factor [Halanaerobiales bacterium]
MDEKLFEARAKIMKALANKYRLKIVDTLGENLNMCVNDLVKELDLNQSSVSKHLNILKSAGVVKAKKEGLKVYYSLRTPCIINYFVCIDNVIQSDIEDRMNVL